MSEYQGLVNQGSTCYLNSLLQTLFMTYEFRNNVYSYNHDPKKIKQKDSIPFQLQKLFVMLQTKQKPAHTIDLLKSFQWTDADAFQQHDVQQFCRVLFESVEKAHKDTGWIKSLFAGSTKSYIDCGKHISNRSEMFLDLSLPIRNSFRNQNYNTLEECLLEYLRPEKLEDKFDCQQCGQKVIVEKGLQFESLPPILTIQLNRFELNFETMTREKVNSFLYFPEILAMHKFMKPFLEIKCNPVPQQLRELMKLQNKSVTHRTVNHWFENVPTAGKPKRKNSTDITVQKQVVTFLDEENKDKRKPETKILSLEEQRQKNKQIMANLKSQQPKLSQQPNKAVAVDLQDDMLFGGKIQFNPGDWAIGGSFQKPNSNNCEIKYEQQEEAFDRNKVYEQGTYALYAVLVHSGGAFGGHYFAYISDGESWYKFDDAEVKKVPRFQMRKYGNNNSSAHGVNAYLLFYRETSTFKCLKELSIPAQLQEKVNKHEQVVTEQVKTKDKQWHLIHRKVGIKVYRDNSSFQLLTIQNKDETTYGQLLQMIKLALQIQEDDENWRIRMYNKSDDTMHQVYGRESRTSTLDTLGFREMVCLIVEFKKSEEVFQDYNPKHITIKINVWKPDIIMVAQNKLKPLRIQMHNEETYEELYRTIEVKTGLKEPTIIRRNFSIGENVSILTFGANRSKRLIDLRFFNGINLYVEPKLQTEKTKWSEQFQNEQYRCRFCFNHPKVGDSRSEEIYFDTRKTLGDLKNKLSELIGIGIDNFRLKKSKQSLSQMTSYKKKLKDLKFINNEYLYLEEGKSSKGSLLVKRGQVSLVDNNIEFNLFEEMQFEIEAELNNVGDLLDKIAAASNLPSESIRLRQYRAYEFKDIYSRSELISRIREKSLVWQKLTGEVQHGTQIYYRIFDVMTLSLGPIGEIYVESGASYEELALIIEEATGLASDRILAWKALSNYVSIDILLDCEWAELKYIGKKVRQDPLYLNTDGDILIIKQAEVAYKAKKQSKNNQMKNNENTKGKQAQLRITVIEETGDEPQIIEGKVAAAEVLTAAPTEAIEVPTVEVSQVNETVSQQPAQTL